MAAFPESVLSLPPTGLAVVGADPFAVLAPVPAPRRDCAARARAAQYIRMSTDQQECSPVIQREAIAKYAREHGLEVVRTYADEGRSGLDARNRQGLCDLLKDAASGWADFGVILVYDVSRWGRFQDCDESAFYEYLCRRAGIRVEYCMEPFRNDGTPMAAVLKALKRMMAGEYSRELSEKVFAAKSRFARMGFRQGGSAGFGLRRQVVDAAGRPRGVLEHGQHKYLHTDRIIQVPGPADEVAVVRWMFREAAGCRRTPFQIALELNRRGLKAPSGRPWTKYGVLGVLTNEKYIGNLIFNRTVSKLRAPRALNPEEKWIRVNGAFPRLVTPALFRRANAALESASWPLSDEAGLEKLRELLARHGRLSGELIDAAEGMPGIEFYRLRFGSLLRAYQLVGFRPDRDYRWLRGYAQRWYLCEALRREIPAKLAARGLTVRRESRKVLVVEERWRVAVMVARCEPANGEPRWYIQVGMKRLPHWLLIARLDTENAGPQDYWLVSGGTQLIQFGGKPRGPRARIRFGDLDTLLDAIATRLGRAPAEVSERPQAADRARTPDAGTCP